MKYNGWTEATLGELCEYIARGITPKYIESSGLAVLNQKCIRNYKVNLELSRMHDINKKKLSEEKRLKKYDVLINSTGIGTAGRVAQWDISIEATCDSHITIVRPNSNKIDERYFGYAVKAQQALIETFAEGSTGQTEMNKQRLCEEIIIRYPSCKEDQIKIADMLSNIDEKIQINKTINENLEQQAQALFKSWFVDFDPFGCTMPSDWKLSTLDAVSVMSAGGDKPKNTSDTKTEKYSVPIFSNGITNEGLYGYTDAAKIHEESVTVSARGTIGFVCLRQEPFVPIVRLVTLIPKSEYISAIYLYFALKQMNIMGSGTTQQQLTVPAFKTSTILIPSHEVMERYTETVTPMFKQINANRAENIALSNTRDILLPKLMSGQIDVSEVTI